MDEALGLQPIRVPVWAWFVVALAIVVLYGLTMENGAVLARGADTMHELFHDARHFLAVPCH